MNAFLRDRFVVGCATFLCVATIASVVILDVMNRGTDAFRFISLIAGGVQSLLVLFSVGKKAQDTHDVTVQAAQAADIAAASAQQSATVVERRLNGELHASIEQAVTDALNRTTVTTSPRNDTGQVQAQLVTEQPPVPAPDPATNVYGMPLSGVYRDRG